MKSLSSRLIVFCVAAALFLVPLYAHHGNQFLSKAMEANAAEVRLGQMAANKTQNMYVKDYAEMLVKDHTEALDKLNQLREVRTSISASDDESTRRPVDIHRNIADIPLTPEHQRTVDRLSQLSGTAFDREFINEMVRDHRQAIADFETQTRVHGNGSPTTKRNESKIEQQARREKPSPNYSTDDLSRDVDTADFARDTLPLLHHHLEEAETIQRELQRR